MPGIILDVIAKPGSTPIVNNGTSAKNFASDYFKLNEPNISKRERMTVAIEGLIHVLTSPLYTANHKGLIQDAMVYTKGISNEFDVWSALAAIDWTNGRAVDPTLETDLTLVIRRGRDFTNLSEMQLTRIYAFLRAQLLS